jgi:hypothetical protein
MVEETNMTRALHRTARLVAMALKDPGLRQRVLRDLKDSPFRENKLHFRTFLDNQTEVLTKMSEHDGKTPGDVLARLDSIVDLEFYIPGKRHFATWDGGADVLVGTVLEDDGRTPVAYDVDGTSIPWTFGDGLPERPTLSLVRVETDFSKIPSATGASVNAQAFAPARVVMVRELILDDNEGGLLGSPEIEMHAFVYDTTFSWWPPLRCSGADTGAPFYYDHEESQEAWHGSVHVIYEDDIYDNPVVLQLWEDDHDPCDYPDGLRPHGHSDTQDDLDNWGAREFLDFYTSGSTKMISVDTLDPDLSVSSEGGFNDDLIGELRLAGGCFPATGPVKFDVYEAESPHDWNGYVFLDTDFGTRTPICPTAPPGILNASISGPTTVQSGASCTWTANVSGGSSPYTYAWTNKLTGSGSTITGSLTSSGWLYLDVDSDDDQDDGDEIYITVSPSGDDCIQV